MMEERWNITRRRLLLVALHSDVVALKNGRLKSSVDHAAFRVSSGRFSGFSSSVPGALSGGSLSQVAQIATAQMNAVRAQRANTGVIGTALLPRRLAFTPPIHHWRPGQSDQHARPPDTVTEGSLSGLWRTVSGICRSLTQPVTLLRLSQPASSFPSRNTFTHLRRKSSGSNGLTRYSFAPAFMAWRSVPTWMESDMTITGTVGNRA
jgi:hypothetical protein